MDKTETTSLYGFEKPPSFVQVNHELYLPSISDITDRDQSQPLLNPEIPIKTINPKPAPMPLLEELPSTSSRDEPKTEELNSAYKFKCPDCDKGFGTEKAMFGHMRIHRNRGPTSGSKRKFELITDHEINTDHLQSKNWGATKVRGSKPLIDRNDPAALAAFELMIISRGGEITSDLVKYVASVEKERKNAAIMEPTALRIGARHATAEKKVKMGPHVCEECGKSYPTGQQLGGHKRAHYKWPEDRRVPE